MSALPEALSELVAALEAWRSPLEKAGALSDAATRRHWEELLRRTTSLAAEARALRESRGALDQRLARAGADAEVLRRAWLAALTHLSVFAASESLATALQRLSSAGSEAAAAAPAVFDDAVRRDLQTRLAEAEAERARLAGELARESRERAQAEETLAAARREADAKLETLRRETEREAARLRAEASSAAERERARAADAQDAARRETEAALEARASLGEAERRLEAERRRFEKERLAELDALRADLEGKLRAAADESDRLRAAADAADKERQRLADDLERAQRRVDKLTAELEAVYSGKPRP